MTYNNISYSLIFVCTLPICSSLAQDQYLPKAAREMRANRAPHPHTGKSYYIVLGYGNVIFIAIIYNVNVIPALCVYYRAGVLAVGRLRIIYDIQIRAHLR